MKKKILAYLTILISIVSGLILGMLRTRKILGKEIWQNKDFSEKHLEMFLAMNEWLKIKQRGKNLKEFFEKKGYRTIAIYGMSHMGERLLDELQKSSIIVKYGIDKNKDGIYLNLNIVAPEDVLEEVDAIIVTPFHYFEEIKKVLEVKVQCPIISLEDILYTF